MTPEAFRARLQAMDMDLAAFAELTKTHPVTASYWGRERPDKRVRKGRRIQEFPGWVEPLLASMERLRNRDPA